MKPAANGRFILNVRVIPVLFIFTVWKYICPSVIIWMGILKLQVNGFLPKRGINGALIIYHGEGGGRRTMKVSQQGREEGAIRVSVMVKGSVSLEIAPYYCVERFLQYFVFESKAINRLCGYGMCNCFHVCYRKSFETNRFSVILF